MQTNDNGFVFVEIQYRLSALGFMTVQNNALGIPGEKGGDLNNGLHDQRLALKWVQKQIKKVGGDPTRVTIGGQGSGAGSAMFHALATAENGADTSLFTNVRMSFHLLNPHTDQL